MRTGPLDVRATDDKGKPLWTMDVGSSRVSMDENERVRADARDVTGALYQQGEEASRFKAQRGQAERENERLVLSGQVVITGKAENLELRADRAVWQRGAKYVVAEGRVTVQGPSYQLGPFERLWATPDLRVRGTPAAVQEWQR